MRHLNLSQLAKQYLPILQWGRSYDRQVLSSDLLAAVIVSIMLIPQSLAYAMLAGLPAQAGMYASILPLIAYGLFGSSRSLSVGPVAVISLMTATALHSIATPGSQYYIETALLLALMSGVMLSLMGLLRLGFLANFLSHPVIAGFISASGIIIACSQLRHILGINISGDSLWELLHQLFSELGSIHWPTFLVGSLVLIFLFWVRTGLKKLLMGIGFGEYAASMLAKAGPIFGVVLSSLIAYVLTLQEHGVALVGHVPSGLPEITLPILRHEAWRELLMSAAFISIIGFVESVSVGHTLAAKRRQKISPNQELLGLGAANVAASFSGGYPVTGGFSRSVVNFDAGAQTPAAGIYTAVAIALVALFLTPYLAYLPKATLAATIIVAVTSLIDLGILKRAWCYDKSDFLAVAVTILVTLLFGVEMGVACGVLASLLLHLYKTSKPHMAVVGEVPGTEHFRNIHRHAVITHEQILSIRVDESLYFANASFIEDSIYELAAQQPKLKHVILMCSAVNEIDLSALETLEGINRSLKDGAISFHLSEVKGPVMDALEQTDFLRHLTGRVWLSQHQAVTALCHQLESESA